LNFHLNIPLLGNFGLIHTCPFPPNYKHGFIEMITWRYHAKTPESVARKPIRKNDGQIKGFKYHEQQFNCILIILLDVYCSVGQVYGLALNPHQVFELIYIYISRSWR